MAKKNDSPSGFSWISNDDLRNGPYITIDVMRRLYISAEARRLMKLPPPPCALVVGYDFDQKRLIIAKPEIARATDVKPFRFDSRWYASARTFVKRIGIDEKALPQQYVYVGKEYGAYPMGSYAFELAD